VCRARRKRTAAQLVALNSVCGRETVVGGTCRDRNGQGGARWLVSPRRPAAGSGGAEGGEAPGLPTEASAERCADAAQTLRRRCAGAVDAAHACDGKHAQGDGSGHTLRRGGSRTGHRWKAARTEALAAATHHL